MTDDRYADQIQSMHLNKTYGKTFLTRFIDEIIGDHGTLLDLGNHSCKAIVKGKSVAVNMFHAASSDLLESDLYVSEVISSHKNQVNLFPEFYGIYHTEFNYNPQIFPDRKLNCFINRSCPFRQSWFYQLIRENLLDNSYVSFWSQNFMYPDLNPAQLFELFYESNKIFSTEHKKIFKQIPYKNFNIPLEDAILASEKSLVLETFFAEEDQISFTEKTMRVLQLPRPWFLFGNPGAVSMLRNWGFDVFDDWIDHSYDNEKVPHIRQRLILDQIHNKIHYTKNLLQEFEARAQQNRNLLKELKFQYFDSKEKTVFDRIRNELR